MERTKKNERRCRNGMHQEVQRQRKSAAGLQQSRFHVYVHKRHTRGRDGILEPYFLYVHVAHTQMYMLDSRTSFFIASNNKKKGEQTKKNVREIIKKQKKNWKKHNSDDGKNTQMIQSRLEINKKK